MFKREQESESERAHAHTPGEAEADTGSLLSKEPNVELDPRALGSIPKLKADT